MKEGEIPFWEEWVKGDLAKRMKLIENLPALQELFDNLKEGVSRRPFVLIFNCLFEDLESTIYSKSGINEEFD